MTPSARATEGPERDWSWLLLSGRASASLLVWAVPLRPFLPFFALIVSSGDADETQYQPEAVNSAVVCQ